jgi:hypothetical protein
MGILVELTMFECVKMGGGVGGVGSAKRLEWEEERKREEGKGKGEGGG